MSRWLLVLCLILLPASALAAERPQSQPIPAAMLERLQGQINVLMPCNFLPNLPPVLTGLYGQNLAELPMPLSTTEVITAGNNTYLHVVVAPSEREGMNEMKVTYYINDRQRCQGASPLDSLMRR